MTFFGKPRRRSFHLLTGAILVAASFAVPSFAQDDVPPPGNPGALVARAVQNRLAEGATRHPLRFLWHKKDERQDTTRQVIETPQGDVAMVVATNGRPLTHEAQQAEFARLDNLAAHPELQEHRRKREAEDNARANKLLRLFPTAFNYHYEATENCDLSKIPEIPVPGIQPLATVSAPQPVQQCYRLSFAPNPKFDPPDMTANILQGMAGEIWIAKTEERLVRLNAHLISDVQFGWGFIGRLDKGGTVYLEQADIGGGDWELTRMNLNLTGKAFLFKSLRIRISEEQGQFQRVPTGTDYRKAIEILKTSAPPNR